MDAQKNDQYSNVFPDLSRKVISVPKGEIDRPAKLNIIAKSGGEGEWGFASVLSLVTVKYCPNKTLQLTLAWRVSLSNRSGRSWQQTNLS